MLSTSTFSTISHAQQTLAPQGFEAFRKEHATVLEARSLAAEDVLAKARIMALLVLGGRRDEVSFATIQARCLAAAALRASA